MQTAIQRRYREMSRREKLDELRVIQCIRRTGFLPGGRGRYLGDHAPLTARVVELAALLSQDAMGAAP